MLKTSRFALIGGFVGALALALLAATGSVTPGPSGPGLANIADWDGGVGITGKLSASELDLATTKKLCLNAACTVYVYNNGVNLYLKSPGGYATLDALLVSGAAVLNNGLTSTGTVCLDSNCNASLLGGSDPTSGNPNVLFIANTADAGTVQIRSPLSYPLASTSNFSSTMISDGGTPFQAVKVGQGSNVCLDQGCNAYLREQGNRQDLYLTAPYDLDGGGNSIYLNAEKVKAQSDFYAGHYLCLNAACSQYIYGTTTPAKLHLVSGLEIDLDYNTLVNGTLHVRDSTTLDGPVSLPTAGDGGVLYTSLSLPIGAVINFGAGVAGQIYLGNDGILYLNTDGSEVHSNSLIQAETFVCGADTTCDLTATAYPPDGGVAETAAGNFISNHTWQATTKMWCAKNATVDSFCIQGNGIPRVAGSAGITMTKHCKGCGAPDGGSVGFDCTDIFTGGIRTGGTCN